MRRLRFPFIPISLLVAAAGWCGAAAPATEPAAPATVRLRIVGGLANVHQYTQHEEPFWTRDLPRLSNGRASAEIVAYDRAGIRGEEMLRLVEVGTVPFGTVVLSIAAVDEPVMTAPDLAGLNPDVTTLRRTVTAFRGHLAMRLRERYGIELLALYIYPAQMTFCAKPMRGLGDLAGRRIRISSPSQLDFVTALGATPVRTEFAAIVPAVKSGSIDCAITGTMSGNTIGLGAVTSHLDLMPISWGLAAFIANGAAWSALPADLRSLLQRELPRLEQRMWAEAERETGEGIDCNVGAASCSTGRRSAMVGVTASAQDDQRRRELLLKTVLPAWIQRCGAECADVWRRLIAPASGIQTR